MRYAAIIVAAGRGTRAGGALPKQWQPIAGRPVAAWTLERFAGAELRILVVHADDRDRAAALADSSDIRVVVGGASRAASVRAGLEALADDAPDRVLIHDVARPCVTSTTIDNVLMALQDSPGAAPALPVTDALWAGRDGRVTGLVPRDGLFRAQTPQGFHYNAIRDAHRHAPPEAADDVAVALAAGLSVAIVDGSEDNLKITGPADFARAAAILERQNGH
ncbi:2-C-methyl-D-erythritol 4-phosphate cytidylyltransferase/2-C-methyl-D-erythritol 4-phosphate cytidylyltransferase / 2-C-methyl-D-erythritol 2,4-cyclodiphosphate synthase [Roseivivax lentus]|uniref:2-C-methyl-D-erythritol 4-phosphate cytidylyltransferase n=1 Tax=Roseivivax lentus TaxID=633194 RepID=A0A1N7LSA2_9RHOB|nr:2-C-methyl-D-erythritol 4-phosphate cytidylyltransferase [Roseivivax lentus]SIS76654.1 2-C-methyl-D-erythritol 4-phosphate cytidylyltransferase/2-C-methyl-D-erythritol 4-phosphate cytidylyltransferase / 2-C-methyl-D-erythritol 2,4-cyclodiphosphate synthase [Roseivivax lentus]